MHDPSEPPAADCVAAIQLLDPGSGRPINSWTFYGQPLITIGRLPDQHIEISDPYVSREHAKLEFRDGRWRLISLGRHGLVAANEQVTECWVTHDFVFRLGREGPTLRFRTAVEEGDQRATISFETMPIPKLALDEQRLQQEVREIAEGDYFQKLKRRAAEMRVQRNAR